MDVASLPVLAFLFLILSSLCQCNDQLTQAKPLSPGSMLISEGGVFALGFFSPANSSKNLYIGIWYHNVPKRTVVWVANRDNPITTPSGRLAITNNLELLLSDSKGLTIWTTTNNVTIEGAGAFAVLLNSGNFVLRLQNGTEIWQSFDHPTDTILPTMRFLLSYRAKVATRLVAWKGPNDPSSGDISSSIDPSSDLQVFIWRNKSFDQCEAECSRNCSCLAYAYAYLSNAGTMGDTSRCLVWTEVLIDMGKATIASENLYLRLGGSPGKRQQKEIQKRRMLEYLRSTDEDGDRNIEFPLISFQDIVSATDNFSESNMLGKGGFGKVYKGVLQGAKVVAIKRLGKGSRQGTEEFRNEVILIAKLQHRNLVKLLGCCIHEDEKLLVYEYLSNKSLDYFLFDSERKPMLQWPTRHKIIQGVARGILYLHQDSRLTIIHRDLKASNILLDKEMVPKISDFGMARIFCSDQHQANTNRVVGTYGYMSPEYAMEGAFSVKSDTYSFGVLLLEVVSELKISSPHLIMDFPNLILYAWNLWKDGKTEKLVDSSVKENCPLDEVSRFIHIGLLCVQDSPDCRPLMSEVVSMLENKTIQLPIPTQPMYFARRDVEPGRNGNNRAFSSNDMGFTELEGR
ncbi:unnamed protein product [Urochloa decumbens]|uniref:non-specific serine/threonine protein kinase n=1 Tax=Urochloa decumbens TaxID=240449 RepID=A0ABC9CSI1_9POAL